MSEEKSVNQKCLENILCHLTKMVVLTEHDEIDYLKQLVKMSTSVSAQLLGVTRQEENNDTENNDKDKWQMWDTSGKCFEFCEKD